jgi:hypothetical protein
MRSPRLTILSLFTLSLALVACDPIGPGAEGQLSLASDTAGFTQVELRFFPDLDGRFDLAGPPELPTNVSEYVQQDAIDVTAAFPYDYSIGTGIGTSKNRVWRVVAWLATESTHEWPNGSEPFATAEVPIDDCGGFDDAYCGITENIDLVLQAPATARQK